MSPVEVLAGRTRTYDRSHGQDPDRYPDCETSEKGHPEVETVAFAAP